MFCKHCGKEINDNAVVCVHCGCAVSERYNEPDPNAPANGWLVFLSFIVPLFGIIYGCIEQSRGRKRAGKAYLAAAMGTMALGVLVYVVSFVVISDVYMR